MAAKLLHSLADDNPDLQKQIGCMTGIFQLFDRQHIRIVGHSPKRLTAGSSHFSNDASEKDLCSVYQRSTAAESQINKNMQDKLKFSTDSSRPLFSSSSQSSSFSFLDCSKPAQPEHLAFDRANFPETPLRDPAMNQIKASQQYGQQILDIRDMVKDSMNREAQGLSVKSKAREAVVESILKHTDSPGPVQLSKAFDGDYEIALDLKQNLPVDLKESLRVLAKLREAPWYCGEPRELLRPSSYHSKDASLSSLSKDFPLESRNISKSNLKLKEQPRLSLDTRDSPVKIFQSKYNFASKPSHQDTGSTNVRSARQQTSGAQARPPSVVVKLMGLETLPNSMSLSETNIGSNKTCQIEDPVPLPRSSEVSDRYKPVQISNSTRSLLKEPTSPRWNPDSIMNPIPRFPIEPAPWRKFDRTRVSEKPAARNSKSLKKPLNSVPSAYSEIEKRFMDLELTESGKDPRALKQILEVMQRKGLLATQTDCQDSNFTAQREHEQKYTSSLRSAQLANQQMRQSDQIATAMRGSNSLRHFESSIVIMKPAKLMEKSGTPSSSVIPLFDLSSIPKLQVSKGLHGRKGAATSVTVKDQNLRTSKRVNTISSTKTNNRTSKSPQISVRSKENTLGPLKTSGSILSPRLQQKKLELEKQSRPPTAPSDLKISRRQTVKQHMESSSLVGKHGQKSSNIQQNDDQLREDEISNQSNGSVIADLKEVTEVTSTLQSFQKSSNQRPLTKTVEPLVSGFIQNKSTFVLLEDELLAEPAMLAPEYPSPVSVLGNVGYTDESPSHVKHISEALKEDRSEDPDRISSKALCNPDDDAISNTFGSAVTLEINRKKLQKIENLVQKLRRLNSSHDEVHTDYIASICESTNPDHRYVAEILLASGLLLEDLGSSITAYQFHPSGHPINPELFLVLEQTKESTLVKEESTNKSITQMKPKEKIHRKFVFDFVNEILAAKLAFVGPFSEPWLRRRKVATNTPNTQKLLRELCGEMEQLQVKSSRCSLDQDKDDEPRNNSQDMLHSPESWSNFTTEISNVVLDVERLVFKDLVDEIVRGNGDSLRTNPTTHRHLFKK